MNRTKALALLWTVLLPLCLGHMAPLQAQENTPEPLVMAFSSLPPFMQRDAGGMRSGFSVELAEMLGAEIGVPIEFLDVQTVPEVVAAQSSGQGQFFAGVVQLPAISQSNVFSDPVASERLLLAVLEKNRTTFSSSQVRDRRIGIITAALGSKEPILSDNTPVEFVNAQTALVALLSGSVDALMLPPSTLYRLARVAGIDGRLAFVGDPLQETTRHVALHESRAELLGPINEAIARLEADGRLQTLRLQYNIVVPAAPPEVLKIGVTQLAPLSVIGDDGDFSGFNVEVTQALAERADLDIEFVPLPLTDWVKGPSFNNVEMISALVITPERLAKMDFAYPFLERKVAAVYPKANTSVPTKVADLVGQKVGTIDGSIFASRANALGTLDVVGFDTNKAVIAAVLAREVDVAVLAPNVVQDTIVLMQAESQLRIVTLRNERIDTALALRPGLGAVRERLNTVTPGYLLSDEYAALRKKYFSEPIFWTQQRLYAAAGVAAAVILGLLGNLFWQRQRQRRREFKRQQAELALEQAHSEELSKIVTELERSNRDLDDFAYIASHDLKEPLRGIGINANFLLREGLTGKAGERVLRMNVLTSRMEQLITDLLFFSRLGQNTGSRITVNAGQILNAIRNDLTEWLFEHCGEIIEIGEIPSLKAERIKLKIVLQNLIVNGIKYNDADQKRVEVGFVPAVEVNGRTLKSAIFVRDNGIGIHEQHREKIFRIFSRLNKDADYSIGVGTGSGLAFVRKIVEEHDGVVDFTSEVGEGTTFYVTFPLANTPT